MTREPVRRISVVIDQLVVRGLPHDESVAFVRDLRGELARHLANPHIAATFTANKGIGEWRCRELLRHRPGTANGTLGGRPAKSLPG
jgi:hypothetical protein